MKHQQQYSSFNHWSQRGMRPPVAPKAVQEYLEERREMLRSLEKDNVAKSATRRSRKRKSGTS